MSDLRDQIVIESLRDASSRIRSVILINLMLCAIIFSNVYANSFAHELTMLRHGHEYIETFKGEITSLMKNHGEKEYLSLDRNTRLRISGLKARIKRIENSLEDFRLNTVKIPIIGFDAYPSSMYVICGLIMSFLSTWLVFSANQIRDIFDDPISAQTIDKCQGAERHIFATIYSTRHPRVSATTMIMIYSPAATFVMLIVNVVWEILSYDYFEKLGEMLESVLITFMIYVVITIVLMVSATLVWSRWRKLTNDLLRDSDPKHLSS